MAVKMLIVAGEASADGHAARLLRALRRRLPEISAYGVGGAALAAEGMEVVVRSESINAVGVADWMDRAAQVIGSFRRIVRLARERRPDLAVLLDLPDFNLRLARRLRAAGIPIVYYISPQVWAWRKYRVRTIRRVVDRMLVVFPFEPEFYRRHGMEARFVGHPLVETFEPRAGERPREERLAAPRIALLPGSRPSEVRHHGELIEETARRLKARYPRCELRVPVATTLTEVSVQKALAGAPVELVGGGAQEVYRWADVALVASGTATLEAALAGVPFALFYKVSPSTAFVVRHFVRYRGFLGMPNVLLGRPAFREFFQEGAEPEALVAEAVRLLEDEPYLSRCREDLRECRQRLGGPGATESAAREVEEVWRRSQRAADEARRDTSDLDEVGAEVH